MADRNITFFDFEVFAHDWLIVMDTDGFVQYFWNDADALRKALSDVTHMCGFNIMAYDVPILYTILSGATPEKVKEVNDMIIGGSPSYLFTREIDGFEPPVFIDLFQDLVPRKSLKEIAANLGLPVVESSVPFTIDRALTEDERADVLKYCRSDVAVTSRLYDERRSYVDSKFALCDVVAINHSEVRRTNAGLAATALGAVRSYHDEVEQYEIPDNIKIQNIPDSILDFVTSANTINAVDDAPEDIKLKKFSLELHGVETVFGLGGIHAAQPNYQAETDDEYVILYQDITSYYPSLILNNNYISRSTVDTDTYRQFYNMRIDAKARGDKQTAEAAKLVLNTTFGASKSRFNPLYDPIKAISICLSGELYIVDLMARLAKTLNDFTIIQLNTDGWIIKVKRNQEGAVEQEIARFTNRTGFNVETKKVRRILQRDVNNYAIQFEDGKIETKGGDFSTFPERSIKAGSLSIIGHAIVNYWLDGTPIEDTINGCNDPLAFQIVHKAGRTFDKTVWDIDGEPVEVQRVNRIYAVSDERYGYVRKVKDDGKSQKIPLCPPHALVDNSNEKVTSETMDLLDREFYVRLAYSKIEKMYGYDIRSKTNGTDGE